MVKSDNSTFMNPTSTHDNYNAVLRIVLPRTPLLQIGLIGKLLLCPNQESHGHQASGVWRTNLKDGCYEKTTFSLRAVILRFK